MKTMDTFGVVTACYPADYALVTATCASIRHNAPDMPIAVIADKAVCLEELVRTYNVRVIRTEDYSTVFPHPISGSYFVKWITFVERPFQSFVYLDSDAILWGPVLRQLTCAECDFTALSPITTMGSEDINKWWFAPDRLAAIDSTFDPSAWPLFCAGAFAAKSDAFTVSELIELQNLYLAHRDTFRFGDQGIFNYGVFRAAQDGRLRVKSVPCQVAVPDLTTEKFLATFSSADMEAGLIHAEAILHFCGRKPFLQYRAAASAPFTWYRFKFFQDIGLSAGAAWSRALREEAAHMWSRATRKLRRALARSSSH